MNEHSGAIMILLLSAMVLGTLLVLVPQLLRSSQRSQDQQHEERLKAMERGQILPPHDDLTRAAARTTALVPMVVMVAVAVVTCFLAAYRQNEIFAVALSVWCVAGVVSLTAITGGVALMGRLAHLKDEEADSGDAISELPAEK